MSLGLRPRLARFAARTRCGWILNRAIEKGRIEVVKLLLQKVEDPLNPNYFRGDNTIEICLLYKPKGYEELVKFFKSFQ